MYKKDIDTPSVYKREMYDLLNVLAEQRKSIGYVYEELKNKFGLTQNEAEEVLNFWVDTDL